MSVAKSAVAFVSPAACGLPFLTQNDPREAQTRTLGGPRPRTAATIPRERNLWRKTEKPDILASSSLRPSTLRAFTLRSPFARHTLRGPLTSETVFGAWETVFFFWGGRENPCFRWGRCQNRFFFFWRSVLSHAKNKGYTPQRRIPKAWTLTRTT